jgi:hypothetical protein
VNSGGSIYGPGAPVNPNSAGGGNIYGSGAGAYPNNNPNRAGGNIYGPGVNPNQVGGGGGNIFVGASNPCANSPCLNRGVRELCFSKSMLGIFLIFFLNV